MRLAWVYVPGLNVPIKSVKEMFRMRVSLMASQACVIRAFFSQNSISSSVKTEYTLRYTRYAVWSTPGNGGEDFVSPVGSEEVAVSEAGTPRDWCGPSSRASRLAEIGYYQKKVHLC